MVLCRWQVHFRQGTHKVVVYMFSSSRFKKNSEITQKTHRTKNPFVFEIKPGVCPWRLWPVEANKAASPCGNTAAQIELGPVYDVQLLHLHVHTQANLSQRRGGNL